MKSENNLKEEVIGLINDIAPNRIKEKNDSLTNDLGMDSLGLIILLTMIEETFEIELDESDMNPFDLKQVCHIVDLAKKYVRGEEK